jgi:hypothetical protein
MDEMKADDALDRLLADARPEAPASLAVRLARGALDPGEGRRVFWLDLERTARRGLVPAAAAAIVAAALGTVAILFRGDRRARAEIDDVAKLAVSPVVLEDEMASGLGR